MKVLFETTVWLVIIQVFVTVHFWIIERKYKVPNHTNSWVLSAVFAIALSWGTYDRFALIVVSVLYLALIYWIVFNFQLNLFRKKPLLYLSLRIQVGHWGLK